MQDDITVTPDTKPQPDLRKLARALIALARRQPAGRRQEAGSGSDGQQGDRA